MSGQGRGSRRGRGERGRSRPSNPSWPSKQAWKKPIDVKLTQWKWQRTTLAFIKYKKPKILWQPDRICFGNFSSDFEKLFQLGKILPILPERRLVWREMEGLLQPKSKNMFCVYDRVSSFEIMLSLKIHLLAKSPTARAAWRVNWSLEY